MDCRKIVKTEVVLLAFFVLANGLIFDEELGVLLPHDPNLTVGSALNMSCKINLSHPDLQGIYDARQIYFELHESKVDSTYINIASNRSQADLSFPDIGLKYDEKYVKCFIDTGTDVDNHIFVDSQHILVGYRPHNIILDEIYVDNWETLRFSYKKAANKIYVTTVKTWWKFSNNISFTQCSSYREPRNFPGYGNCSIDIFNPTTSEKNTLLEVMIKVNASNVVGKAESDIVTFNVTNKVKPGKVEKLAAVVLSKEEIRVDWTLPRKDRSFQCNITYFDEWEPSVLKMKTSQAGGVLLTDLIPYTIYTVSVACKSAIGGYWSDKATVSNRTLASVPAVEPKVISYLLEQTSETKRSVTVFWQTVEQKFIQGKLRNYVVRFGETGAKVVPHWVPEDQTYLTINDLKTTSEYFVYVAAETSEGLNPKSEHQTISIPKQAEASNLVDKMVTLVAQNDSSVVHVRYTSSDSQCSAITLFWCRYDFTNKVCKDVLHLKTLESCTIVLAGLTEGFDKYQYGVAGKDKNMRWINCVYDYTKNAAPPLIRMKERREESLVVALEEEDGHCSDHQGFVIRYKLTWCVRPAETSQLCPENSSYKYVDKTKADSIVIEDLDSETYYQIEAASITENLDLSFKEDIQHKKVIEYTEAALGGMETYQIALIVVALIIVIIGIASFLYRYGRKIMKFLQNKAGKPIDPPGGGLASDDEHEEEMSDLSEVIVRGKRDPPSGEESQSGSGGSEHVALIGGTEETNHYETTDQPVVNGAAIVAPGTEEEGEETESDSGYVKGEGSVNDSAEVPYKHDHLPDETKPINLFKHPNQTYTKDHSYNKHPQFRFGKRSDVMGAPATTNIDTPVGPHKVPGLGDGNSHSTVDSGHDTKDSAESKYRKHKRPKPRKRHDDANFANPKLAIGAIPKQYNRGYSTDDSSSSGGGYAPGKMHIGLYARQDSTASNDGVASSDRDDDVAGSTFGSGKPAPQETTYKGTKEPARLDSLTEESSPDKTPPENISTAAVMPVSRHDDSESYSLDTDDNKPAAQTPIQAELMDQTEAGNNQDALQDEDGLGWDSSDEENNHNYTKQKKDEPDKHFSDSTEEEGDSG